MSYFHLFEMNEESTQVFTLKLIIKRHAEKVTKELETLSTKTKAKSLQAVNKRYKSVEVLLNLNYNSKARNPLKSNI